METGRLVVLIHGSLDRSAGMARLGRQLVSRARVLRYDRRGYGRSWPHTGPFTVSAQVDDLEACLNGRRAILVGHSFGGNIALAAAQRLGNQIEGVSTYETPLSWMDWWPADTAGGLGVSAGPELAAEKFLTRLVGETTWNSLPERAKEARRREGRALVGELGELRRQAPWEASLIRCKVMCGMGSDAKEHHQRAARWLSSVLPNAAEVELQGAGHGAPHTHPGAFAEALVNPHLDHSYPSR